MSQEEPGGAIRSHKEPGGACGTCCKPLRRSPRRSRSALAGTTHGKLTCRSFSAELTIRKLDLDVEAHSCKLGLVDNPLGPIGQRMGARAVKFQSQRLRRR